MPKLRVLHYLYTKKDNGRVVAHCLDLDLVVGANDDAEAQRRLDALVTCYLEQALSNGNYQALATTAPDKYWEKFSEAFAAGHVKDRANKDLVIRVPAVVPTQPSSRLQVLSTSVAAAA
jgi:hypothetical protein